MAGMSLSLILFILYVIVPGYMFLTLSGRPASNGSRFWEAVLHGSAFFGAVFLWALAWAEWRGSRLVGDFLRAIADVSAGRPAETFGAVPLMLALLYGVMLAASFVSLVLDASPRARRWLRARKIWLLRALTGFPLDADLPPVEVSPREPLLSLLLAYRRAGRRPYLKIALGEGEPVEGECLRFCWDNGGSLLVRDADDPAKLNWVRLSTVKRVEFTNLFSLEAEPEPEPQGRSRLLGPAEAYILDAIVPGLAAETRRRMREELRRPGD